MEREVYTVVALNDIVSSGCSLQRLYLLVGPAKQVQVAALLCLRFSLSQCFGICIHDSLKFKN